MGKIIGAYELKTKLVDDLPNEARSLGPQHSPMPHRESALVMLEGLFQAGLVVRDQEFVVDGVRSRGARGGGNYGDIVIPGANLFAMFEVALPDADPDSDPLLVAYRNSVAQVLARQACVGRKFRICTNISVFGRSLVFAQKNTPGNTGDDMIREIVRRIPPMLMSVEEQLDRLRNKAIGGTYHLDSEILSLFEDKTLPVKYLAPLTEILRTTDREAADGVEVPTYPEVADNRFNRLGLMHAATRVIQDAGPRQQTDLSQRIGAHFNYGMALAA